MSRCREVDGEVMEGAVRERAQAKQEYHQAVQSGQTAGHVATARYVPNHVISVFFGLSQAIVQCSYTVFPI